MVLGGTSIKRSATTEDVLRRRNDELQYQLYELQDKYRLLQDENRRLLHREQAEFLTVPKENPSATEMSVIELDPPMLAPPSEENMSTMAAKILKLGSAEATVVLGSMKWLSDLLHFTKQTQPTACEQRTEFVRLGGTGATASAMLRFGENQDVVASGCFLFHCCMNHTPHEYRDIAVKSGCLEIILAATICFPACERIQECGFGAIFEMGCFLDGGNYFVHKIKGLDMVLPLIKRHIRNEKIMEWAMWSLAILVGNKNTTKNRPVMVAAGVKDVVEDVLKQHYYAVTVRNHASTALRGLE